MNIDLEEKKKLIEIFNNKNFKELEYKVLNLLKISDDPFLYDVLGTVYLEINNFSKSEECFNKALKKNPNSAETYNNLGYLHYKLKKNDLAINYFNKAIEIKPNLLKSIENLGNIYFRKNDFQNAVKFYSRYLNLNNKNPGVFYNLSRSYASLSIFDEALRACESAIKIKPEFISALNLYNTIKKNLVPGWHARMMNDNLRNEFYFNALKEKIKSNSTVFEIGAGSGLLSIISSKLGAKNIYSCEKNKHIYNLAKEIIAENGLQKNIKLFNCSSYDILPNNHFDNLPDIIVSELISNEFLAEGVLEIINDAKKRLLNKKFEIIPEVGNINISLIGGGRLKKYLDINNYRNINLQKFKNFTPKKITLNYDLIHEDDLLSNCVSIFDFDFTEDDFNKNFEKSIILKTLKKEICYGVIQWVRIAMKSGLEYENKPGQKNVNYHWDPVIYLFDKPLLVEENQEIEINCKRDNMMVWFFLKNVLKKK